VPKFSRDKGARWERQVANDLQAAGAMASRNLSQTRDSGVDVVAEFALGPEHALLHGRVGYRLEVECKAHASYWGAKARAGIGQVTASASGPWALVVKENRQEPLAVLPWSQLLELLRLAHGTG